MARFLCVLPVALLLNVKWPSRRDWPAVAALGLCFFGLFFVFYNIAVGYTTAARASLALSTLPLQTMVVGALLGIEPLTLRKSLGVGIAVLGVFVALASGLEAAPPGAWRGELIMIGAALCMAFYNVWSRPFIQRSSALGFSRSHGGGRRGPHLFGSRGTRRRAEHLRRAAIVAASIRRRRGRARLILWVSLFSARTPTRVPNMTVNPIAAGLLANVVGSGHAQSFRRLSPARGHLDRTTETASNVGRP